MKYEDLETNQKYHVNGVIAKLMDNYIRNNLIWTPEQIYLALYKDIDEQHKKGWYGPQNKIGGKWVFVYYQGNAWLTTPDAKDYIMNMLNKKYEKNKKLARKDSPLIERARFGLKWDDNKFYDINWGLKNGFNFEKTDIVENTDMIPWSISHVEDELQKRYEKDLKTVLSELCKSPLEIKFYEAWLSLFFVDKENPALIPEFCGTRSMFYCYRDNGYNYFLEPSDERVPVNVRYDFAIINYQKQKNCLLSWMDMIIIKQKTSVLTIP